MPVRPATVDDIEAIQTVARESWDTDYPGILSRETVESGFDEWYGDDQIRAAIEDPLTLVVVAQQAESVVGFAHGVLDGETGVVLRLYVHPGVRGDGTGTELCESITRRLRDHDVTSIKAMVLAENEPGNSFYRSFGFEQVDQYETTIAGEKFTENTYELDLTG